MKQSFYFGAGPALIPDWVKQQIEIDLWDYQNTGLSVMEINHRSEAFDELMEDAKQRLRNHLSIPDDYEILFMHGGASAQFDAIPLNLLPTDNYDPPLYLVSGHWSRRAAEMAQQYDHVEQWVMPTSNQDSFERVSALFQEKVSNLDVPYIYVTPNETIEGVEYEMTCKTRSPLVADMTSYILTRTFDVRNYQLIYAGAQKMLGISGLCLVIVHRNLLMIPHRNMPHLYDYRLCHEYDSRNNTPPVFAIYVLAKMLEWLEREGGVEVMQERARQRADFVYQVVDSYDVFRNEVPDWLRSRLNVPFQLPSPQLEDKFLQTAEQAGLTGLAGHRMVGGVRASMYNAMPIEGAKRLADFMQEFARTA